MELLKQRWIKRYVGLRQSNENFDSTHLTFITMQVPVCSKTHPHLGRWVDNQRQAYRMYMESKRSWLNAERIAALDSVNFVWCAQTIPALSFAERLQQMREFREQNGHTRVPNRHPSVSHCKLSSLVESYFPSSTQQVYHLFVGFG